MALDRIYLTVARKKRQPQNDGYIAVISRGQVQCGDREEDCVILDVNVVKNMKEASAWYKRARVKKPWETRQ